MKIINLGNGIKIKTSEIKKLRDKPIRLYVSFGKEEKADYSIEFWDGTFIAISKQQYKMIKNILKEEGR